MSDPDPVTEPLLEARARVLHDLAATGVAEACYVDVLEDAVAQRRWWLQQWPQGERFVVGLVAQDVQDRLIDSEGRWPPCRLHASEAMSVEPELGPDPHWVCARCGSVAPVGAL